MFHYALFNTPLLFLFYGEIALESISCVAKMLVAKMFTTKLLDVFILTLAMATFRDSHPFQVKSLHDMI